MRQRWLKAFCVRIELFTHEKIGAENAGQGTGSIELNNICAAMKTMHVTYDVKRHVSREWHSSSSEVVIPQQKIK
jgi:hypothetical protein